MTGSELQYDLVAPRFRSRQAFVRKEKAKIFARLERRLGKFSAYLDVLSESPLIQLLNRHTYQASRNNPDCGRDFGGPAMAQVPCELYFIFRMRLFLGLENPEIDHRLTAELLNQLPTTGADDFLAAEDCAFLEAVSAYEPDFFGHIDRMKIRDWKFLF